MATKPASVLALITPATQCDHVDDCLAMVRGISGGLPAFQAGMSVISLHHDTHPHSPILPPSVKRITLPKS